MNKKYRLSESWGDGSHYIGTMELQDAPEFMREKIQENPNAASWEIEIPESDGLILVATISDD